MATEERRPTGEVLREEVGGGGGHWREGIRSREAFRAVLRGLQAKCMEMRCQTNIAWFQTRMGEDVTHN